jgi:hypothetical protein
MVAAASLSASMSTWGVRFVIIGPLIKAVPLARDHSVSDSLPLRPPLCNICVSQPPRIASGSSTQLPEAVERWRREQMRLLDTVCLVAEAVQLGATAPEFAKPGPNRMQNQGQLLTKWQAPTGPIAAMELMCC